MLGFHRSLNSIQKRLPILILFALLLIIPVLILFTQQNQDLRERAAANCTSNTGVNKNPNGTVQFAWLHVTTNGDIQDANNCPVHLLGLNQGWYASGDGGSPTAQELASWHQ